MQTGKSVCVTCREINKSCEHEKISCGYKWAAPRKTNDKAWKRIADGDIWWDKKRISRPLRQGKESPGWRARPALRTKEAMRRMRARLVARTYEDARNGDYR